MSSATAVTRDAPSRRRTWTAEVMGTVASVQVVSTSPLAEASVRVDACLAELRQIEAVFSPFRSDSDVSRIARGEVALDDADPLVTEVAAACLAAEQATGGRFSAWRDGTFDPTGFVKGWAVERAAARHLAPLLAESGCLGTGLNVGGDMQLLSAEGTDWTWRVGLADPSQTGSVLATLELAHGAVATSGPAERGSHIVDPRTGLVPTGVASATVVAESLTIADVWATAAVVAGFDDLSWIAESGTITGLIVAEDGRVRRWIDGVEVTVAFAGDPLELTVRTPSRGVRSAADSR